MYNNIVLFLITIVSKFHFSKQTFEEMILPLNSTSEFKGFIIRKINETSIYISNVFQEVIFDFKTIPKPDDEFKRINLEEGTFMGSLYPQIRISAIEDKTQPIYYVSKTPTNSFYVRFYNYENNSSSNLNLSNNTNYLPISFSMNENSQFIYGVVRHYYNATYCYHIVKDNCNETCYYSNRSSYCCGDRCDIWKYPWKVNQRIYIYKKNDYYKEIIIPSQENDIDGGRSYAHKQKSKGFILPLKNGNIILYDMYRFPSTKFTIYLRIIHNDFRSYNTLSNTVTLNECSDDNSPIYFQSIEIKDDFFLTCYLSIRDYKSIYCFSFQYRSTNSISPKKGFPTMQLLKQCDSQINAFSLYTRDNTTNLFLIACIGKNFVLEEYNYDNFTRTASTSIIFNNPDLIEYTDFTVISPSLLIIGFIKHLDNYNYHYYKYYWPYCLSVNTTIILKTMEKYLISSLFADELFQGSTIMEIISSPGKKGKLCDQQDIDICFTLGLTTNILYINSLYYISDTSTTDTFTYRTKDLIPGASYTYSTQCSFTITVCYIGCKTCTGAKSGDNHNCIECDNENGYYWDNSPSSKKCVQRGTGYYIDSNDKSYKPCYPICKTCYTAGRSIDDPKCIQCDDSQGYFTHPIDVTSCITGESQFLGYYYNHTSNSMLKCPDYCIDCSEESVSEGNKCLHCNNNTFYFTFEDEVNNLYFNCFNNQTKERDWYFDYPSKLYKKCYSACNNCTIGGNSSKHNCNLNECKDEFIIDRDDKSQCSCEYYHYIDSNDNYHCMYPCQGNYNYLIREKNQCVNNCLLTDYPYIYNYQCYKKCPNGTSILGNNIYICEDNNKCSINNEYTEFNSELIYYELKKIVEKYNEEYSISNSHIKTIKNKNENFNLILYKNEECANKILDKKIVKLNLTICQNLLREKYSIPKNIPLTVALMNFERRNNKPNKITFSIYNSQNSKLLDPFICNEDNSIKVEININEKENNINLEKAKEMKNKGIDVFNISDPFFNDICNTYSENGKDVILNDRVLYYYQNISLCDEGCNYSKVDLENSIYECNCHNYFTFSINNTNDIQYDENILKNKDSDSIFNVMKCMKNSLFSNFLENKSSILVSSCAIVQLSSTVIYILLDLSKVSRFIIGNPPKKKKANKNRNNYQLSLKEENGSSSTFEINSKNKLKTIQNNNLVTNEKLKPNDLSDKIIDYDDLTLINVEKYDKRTFYQFYCYFLKVNQMFIYTFITKNPFDPFSMKLNLYFLKITLAFLLNGLLYSKKYISDRFKSNEENDFTFFLHNSYKRVLLCCFIEIILFIIINSIKNPKKLFRMYYFNKDSKNNLNDETLLLYISFKRGNYVIIIINFIILIISYLFLTPFSFIFKNSQLDFILSGVFTVILLEIYSFFSTLIITSMRYLGIYLSNETFYNMSLFFIVY